MSVLVEIHSLIPAFEARLGGRSATEEQRRIYACNPNCMDASDIGKTLLDLAGIQPVRREWHFNESPKMGHVFLSLLEMGAPLGETDFLIDPTYLQFADPTADIDCLPNVFLGSRDEIVGLMRDRGFTSRTEAADLYLEQTWMPGKN